MAQRCARWCEDSGGDFVCDALDDEWRDCIELILQEIRRPGEDARGFPDPEIDSGTFDIRENGTDFVQLLVAVADLVLFARTHPRIRRRSPEGFLTEQPDTIDDIVDEVALASNALSGDHVAELMATGEAGFLKVHIIAGPVVVHEAGGGKSRPVFGLGSKTPVQVGLLDFGGKIVPVRAVGCSGVGPPVVSGNQMGLELCWW